MATRASILTELGEEGAWDWNAIPQQYDFLTAQEPFTMLSGAFAGGKSSALVARCLAYSMYVPGNLGFLGRLDGKSLRHSTMQTFDEMVDPRMIQQRNDQLGVLRFRKEYGGSKILYGDVRDLNDLKNINLGWFALDQAEEVEKVHWDYLVGRLRRRNFVRDPATNARQYYVIDRNLKAPQRCPQNQENGLHVAIGKHATKCELCRQELVGFSERRDRSTHIRPWTAITYPNFGFGVCNPEGRSHWIYQTFSGLPGPGGSISEGLPGYKGTTVTVYDSLDAGFITDDYVRNMELTWINVPHMRERYADGIWVEAEGRVYPAWDRTKHIVNRHAKRWNEAELIPSTLPMFEFIDHGFSNSPTGVGWFIIEPCECGCGKHNFWIVDDYKVASQTISYHALQIKQRREQLGRKLQLSYLDSQCFSKNQDGSTSKVHTDEIFSIADLYIGEGIIVSKNQKTWDIGYDVITSMLADDPDHQHPVTGESPAPHLYTLSHCTDFIQEIETYKWKKVRPGMPASEEPVDGNDDLMDGLNGAVAGRPELNVEHAPPVDERPEHIQELEAELDAMTNSHGSHMSF